LEDNMHVDASRTGSATSVQAAVWPPLRNPCVLGSLSQDGLCGSPSVVGCSPLLGEDEATRTDQASAPIRHKVFGHVGAVVPFEIVGQGPVSKRRARETAVSKQSCRCPKLEGAPRKVAALLEFCTRGPSKLGMKQGYPESPAQRIRASSHPVPLGRNGSGRLRPPATSIVACDQDVQARIQALMDATFVRTWTRDRKLRAREETVPSRLLVQSVDRIDNPERFGCFSKRRDEFSSSRAVSSKYEIVSAVTAAHFKELAGVDPCVSEAFLFHGTSRDSAVKIATSNLRLGHARSDGLFGQAGYFAEHSSKADEYSKKDGSGMYTMIVCRVVLGATLVTDEHHNDAKRIKELHGALDRGDCQSIMGVRRKTGYREFAIRDFELVFPEFIVRYHKQWTHT